MLKSEETKSNIDLLSENKAVTNQVFEAIDKGDTSKVKKLLSTDFELTAPGITEPLNADAVVQLIETHYKAFPDWKHNIESLVAENNIVIAKILQEGTHKAEFEGIPATNKHVYQAAMCELTISNGKIEKMWAMDDYLGLYSQLGMELKAKDQQK